ncbi:MAG TPA: aldehyde dehydrogenase family protein [Streptosporangiaceae bacterium]
MRGRGTADGVECGPLVSAQQLAKTADYVASALAEGATLVCGGDRPGPSDVRPASGFFYLPTVLDGCHREMRVIREETFGPILTVETFTTEDAAVALANDTEYGLAGAVWINDFHPYLPQAEWGGMGKSGIYENLRPAPVRWFAG